MHLSILRFWAFHKVSFLFIFKDCLVFSQNEFSSYIEPEVSTLVTLKLHLNFTVLLLSIILRFFQRGMFIFS